MAENFNPKTCRSPLDTQVSLFPNAVNVNPIGEPTLREVLASIKQGKYKGPVEKLRALKASGDEATYETDKLKLPAFSLSARLTTRAKDVPLPEKLIAHTHIMQIDIDEVPDAGIETLEEKLKADPYVLFSFRSPGGTLKAGIRIDGTKHDDSFLSAARYFLEKYGVKIDPKVKEVPRLCFVSYDPHPYINETAQILPVTSNGTKPATDSAPKQSYSSPSDPGRKLTYGERAIETAKKMIEQSADGEKLNVLLKAGKLLGGYVAGGMISERDAQDALRSAIENKPHVNHLNTAYKAIDDSLKHGQQVPIAFEDLERQRAEYLQSIGVSENSLKRTQNDEPPQNEWEGEFVPDELFEAARSEQDGDAALLVRLHSNRFRYDHSSGKWYEWTGHYWKEDLVNEALAAVDSVTELYGKEAERLSWAAITAAKAGRADEAKNAESWRKVYLRKISCLQKVQWKQSILQLAASGKGSLGIAGDEWDSDPWALPCKNGVINLRDGSFRSGRPEDFFKTICPTEWKGLDEPAPAWDCFQARITNDEEIPSFKRRLFGSSLPGIVIEQVFPIFHGEGRNGKGTEFETIKFVLGPLAGPMPAEMLLKQRDSKNPDAPSASIMALRGKRIVWASETERGRRFNIPMVKWLVGADTLVGRDPFGKRQVEFSPTHSLFLLTNDKPRADASGFAFWNRVLLIPFPHHFVDDPQKPCDRKRDPHLLEKLKTEASGILAWLVGGCLEWQAHGLNPPETVRLETEQYHQEEDRLGRFIDECCVVEATREVEAGRLFKAYQGWSQEFGEKHLGGRTFGDEMKKRFNSYKLGTIRYIGIGLVTGDSIRGGLEG